MPSNHEPPPGESPGSPDVSPSTGPGADAPPAATPDPEPAATLGTEAEPAPRSDSQTDPPATPHPQGTTPVDGSGTGPTRPSWRDRWTVTRLVAIGTAVGLVVVAGLVVWSRPNAEPEPDRVGAEQPSDKPVEVRVELSLESLDAGRGLLRTRLTAVPGPDLPDNGVVVVADVLGLAPVSLGPKQLEASSVADVRTADADIESYPFDTYEVELPIAMFDRDAKGEIVRTPVTDRAVARSPENMIVTGIALIPGFEVTGTSRTATTEDGFDEASAAATDMLVLRATRTQATITWVVLMMAVYWSMAALAVASMLAVVLGQRSWQWTQMSWMGAMIFAMVAFRNAAPGNPPIGVWFDYAAFFPAETIVASSIVCLGAYFLLARRETVRL